MYYSRNDYLWIVGCLSIGILLSSASRAQPTLWGFWAHRHINKMAVYRLPIGLAPFFKQHLDFITENAVNPDKRRYAVVGEAEKHYIDLDAYTDPDQLPLRWHEAVQLIGEDSLRRYGIAPWNIELTTHQLTAAFKDKNYTRILRLSADLGHYVGDLHVPLHTTKNYNGQLTNQEGIHAFWESRLPELLAHEYDFWIGPVSYVTDIPQLVWKTVWQTHAACDSVLRFEKELTQQWKASEKYNYEVRLSQTVKLHSKEFSMAYHNLLDGQVERQMRAAIQMTSNLWYTCWINAGQPDLVVNEQINPVDTQPPYRQELFELLRRHFRERGEAEDDSSGG